MGQDVTETKVFKVRDTENINLYRQVDSNLFNAGQYLICATDPPLLEELYWFLERICIMDRKKSSRIS